MFLGAEALTALEDVGEVNEDEEDLFLELNGLNGLPDAEVVGSGRFGGREVDDDRALKGFRGSKKMEFSLVM